MNDELDSQTRSQILASEPLPPLEKILNIVTQEELHKKLMVGRDDRTETAAAFAVSHGERVQPSTACKHCGRFGHEEANCFEILGYPRDPVEKEEVEAEDPVAAELAEIEAEGEAEKWPTQRRTPSLGNRCKGQVMKSRATMRFPGSLLIKSRGSDA